MKKHIQNHFKMAIFCSIILLAAGVSTIIASTTMQNSTPRALASNMATSDSTTSIIDTATAVVTTTPTTVAATPTTAVTATPTTVAATPTPVVKVTPTPVVVATPTTAVATPTTGTGNQTTGTLPLAPTPTIAVTPTPKPTAQATATTTTQATQPATAATTQASTQPQQAGDTTGGSQPTTMNNVLASIGVGFVVLLIVGGLIGFAFLRKQAQPQKKPAFASAAPVAPAVLPNMGWIPSQPVEPQVPLGSMANDQTMQVPPLPSTGNLENPFPPFQSGSLLPMPSWNQGGMPAPFAAQSSYTPTDFQPLMSSFPGFPLPENGMETTPLQQPESGIIPLGSMKTAAIPDSTNKFRSVTGNPPTSTNKFRSVAGNQTEIRQISPIAPPPMEEPAFLQQQEAVAPGQFTPPPIQSDPILETIMRQAQMGLYALPNRTEIAQDAFDQ